MAEVVILRSVSSSTVQLRGHQEARRSKGLGGEGGGGRTN